MGPTPGQVKTAHKSYNNNEHETVYRKITAGNEGKSFTLRDKEGVWKALIFKSNENFSLALFFFSFFFMFT